MNTYFIYHLKREGAIIYVGMTERPGERECEHKILKIEGSERTALALELTYINKYLDQGITLLNRENKNDYTRVRKIASFTALPEIVKAAKLECWKENVSFSSKVEELLKQYVESKN